MSNSNTHTSGSSILNSKVYDHGLVTQSASSASSCRSCVSNRDSAWQALLDSLCPQAQATPIPLPSSATSTTGCSVKHDTSLSSTHCISTQGSSSPLTSSAPSLMPHTPRSSQSHVSVPRLPSPIACDVRVQPTAGLPPPLLSALNGHDADGALDVDGAATPSTTTLVPRSALSSAMLGPRHNDSERSSCATPAMTVDDAGFCFSGDPCGGIPPELCTTLVAHDDGTGKLDDRGTGDSGSAPPPMLRVETAALCCDDDVVSPRCAGATLCEDADDGIDAMGDDSCREDRGAWKPPTFASMEVPSKPTDTSTWTAALAEGHATEAPHRETLPRGSLAGTSAPLNTPCSTFYDLYHVVNRATAVPHRDCSQLQLAEASDGVAEAAMVTASAAHGVVPALVELEKIVPKGARLDPQKVGELCSFVLEDDPVESRPRSCLDPKDDCDWLCTPVSNTNLIARGTPSFETALYAGAAKPTDRPLGRCASSMCSFPSAHDRETPVVAKPAADVMSIRTMTLSGTSSPSLVHPLQAVDTKVFNCGTVFPSSPAQPDERQPKPRGVLSVQNLRAHKARVGVYEPAPARPTAPSAGASVATLDTASSRVSGAAAAAARRHTTGCLKPTRMSLCGTSYCKEPVEEGAFKACQFLCLADVKEAVVRACADNDPASPVAHAASPDPEIFGGASVSHEFASCSVPTDASAVRLPARLSHAYTPSPMSLTTPVTLGDHGKNGPISSPPDAPSLSHHVIDKESALLLAAAFTNAHLVPPTLSSHSPAPSHNGTPLVTRHAHSRVLSGSTALAGSATDRMSSTKTTSVAPLSYSTVCAGCTDNDEPVIGSFSVLLSPRRDSRVGATRVDDPLEHKVLVREGGWSEEEVCPLDGVAEASGRVQASSACGGAQTPVMDVGGRLWLLGGVTQIDGRLETSQGTTASVPYPLSSVESRPATSVPLFSGHDQSIVIDFDLISTPCQVDDGEGAQRQRRMYCHSFSGELADVAQLERWAKACALVQQHHIIYPTVSPVVSHVEKSSTTEVTT